MTTPEGMPDETLTAGLRKKWGLTNEPDLVRANITAFVLDNQDRHFKRLAGENTVVGTEWTVGLMEAIKTQLRTHPLPDLCSIQPMTGPIGLVFFFRTRASGVVDGIPEIRLDIADAEIRAESRMCKAHHQDADTTMEEMVEGLLTEIAREVLSTMMNGVTKSSTITAVEGTDFKEQLARASNTVYRQTQRGPANRVVANVEMLKRLGVDCPDIEEDDEQIRELVALDGKWRIFLDPLFPKGKLMAWYHGTSVLDTGLIYSPYTLYEITPNFINPDDMTLRRAVRTRHKITLVRPEFAALLQFDNQN